MVADLARALKTVVTTGKAKFGLEETRRAIASGTARLVVVAENCPDKELLAGPLKVRRIIYPGDNLALGAAWPAMAYGLPQAAPRASLAPG
jgi:large subunit ribosomal protein L30e